MWMLKSEPIDPNSIYIHDKKLITTTEEANLKLEEARRLNYLLELKQCVFYEVIERIEKNMDMDATDILDAARVKLKNIKENSKMILIALKPVCLLFLAELYQATQVNI